MGEGEPVGERVARIESKLDVHLAEFERLRQDRNERFEHLDEKLSLVLIRLATFPDDHAEHHRFVTSEIRRREAARELRDKVMVSVTMAIIGIVGGAIWANAEAIIRFFKKG